MVVFRDLGLDQLDIRLRMQTLDVGETGERRLFAFQHVERRRFERIVNRAQAIRPLRVSVTGIVFEAGWMGEKQSWHSHPMGGEQRRKRL